MKKRVLGMIGIMVSGYSLFLVIHGVYGIRDTIGFYIQYIDGWMWAGINYHMILFLYQLIGTLLELSYGTMGVLCFVFPIKEKRFYITALLYMIGGTFAILYKTIGKIGGPNTGFIALPFVIIYYLMGLYMRHKGCEVDDIRDKFFPFMEMLH